MTSGIKYDTGKLRWSIFPWPGAEDVMKVIEYGAGKYSPGNWKNVLSDPFGEERYLDAALRHLLAHAMGEKLDPESGLPHLAHACCCLLFLLTPGGSNGWWEEAPSDTDPSEIFK